MENGMVLNFVARRVAVAVLLVSGLGASACQADIVGGVDLTPGDPIARSTVALYRETREGGMLCTATLIAKDMALTAAHCVENGTDGMVVVIGDDIRGDDRALVRVAEAEIAREWKETHVSDQDMGDIAVVRLEGKLPKGYHPAHLLPAKAQLKTGESVVLAGYGIDNAKKHSGAGTLRKTSVKIAEPEFGKTEILFDQSASGGACHGDSGGPAYLEQGGKIYLLAVTNRGYPETAPDDCKHQVVYTKVSAYRKWITRSVREMRGKKSR